MCVVICPPSPAASSLLNCARIKASHSSPVTNSRGRDTMTIESHAEPRFYEALLVRLKQPSRAIDLYSVSACFGFYTRGMKVFADVLRALELAVTRPAPHTTVLRALLRADDHLIDTFGIDRFHAVLNGESVTIHEMEEPTIDDEWIQFAVFDHREVIYTTPQLGFNDNALGLGVNRVSSAQTT